MKRILLLCLVTFSLHIASWGYSFKVSNIYYNISSNKRCKVTFKDFSYNSYSGNVSIPVDVTYSGTDYLVVGIDVAAFWGSTGLKSVTIPESVTEIGNSAFYECTKLPSITIPESVTSIGRYAFGYCAALTEVTIPDNVTSLGEYAFYGCSGLTQVNFNATACASAGNYGNSAFWGCTNISIANFGDNVTMIPSCLCCDLTKLTQVTIPESVTSIGDYAFMGCTALGSIISLNPEPPTCRNFVFNSVPTGTCVLYVPKGSKEAYSTANTWEDFYNIEEILSAEELYDKLTEDFNATREVLLNAWSVITSDCPDVVDDFMDDYTALGDEIEELAQVVDDAYKAESLNNVMANEVKQSLSAISQRIEEMLINAEDAEKDYINNKPLYDDIVAEVEATSKSLSDVWTSIETKCPDMTDDLQENRDGIAAEIEAVKAELDAVYEASELNEEKAAEIREKLATIEQEIEDMLAYASQLTGIDGIFADYGDDVRVYDLVGHRVHRLERGNVYIIRYSDGTSKKVLVK